jgi:hypothetical protein
MSLTTPQHCQFILFDRTDVFNLIDALERAMEYEIDNPETVRELNFHLWCSVFCELLNQLLHNMDPNLRKEIERVWEMRRIGAPSITSSIDISKI